MKLMASISDHVKWTLDGTACGIVVAAFVEWLPPIAAGLSIVWLLMQMSDWVIGKFKKGN